MEIEEFQGFPEEAGKARAPEFRRSAGVVEQTLGVVGMGEDAAGEIYITGNATGFPSGNGGVVLRLTPADD